MQVNGHSIPGWAISMVIVGLIALGGLQTQVFVNADSIDTHQEQGSHTEAGQKLATLEATQEAIKNDLSKIESHNAAQTELLNQILYALAEQRD